MSWSVSEGTASLAEQGQVGAVCRLLPSIRISSLSPCAPRRGSVLEEIQLFSNEIPRAVVKSLLSLVHKMCWLDKALRNFKIMLLLNGNLHEDFRSIQNRDVVAGTSVW